MAVQVRQERCCFDCRRSSWMGGSSAGSRPSVGWVCSYKHAVARVSSSAVDCKLQQSAPV